MRRIFLILIFLQSTLAFAQVPADSLTGVYAGKYWYANPSTSTWIITNDTAYITSIDSTNCIWQGYSSNFSCGCVAPAATYYTDYFSCNSISPSNYYLKFYSGDSIRLINDNIPQPPPNQPISYRFYGKRVGPYYGMGVKQFVGGSNQISIYPNPASTMLHVELKMQNERAQIQISNTLGQEVISTKEKEIDVSSLQEGIYFVRVKTTEGISTQKVIIQH